MDAALHGLFQTPDLMFALVVTAVGFLAGKPLCRAALRSGGRFEHVRMVQCITAGAFFCVAVRFGFSLPAFQFLVLTGLLVCIAVADVSSRTIPNLLVILAVANRLVFIAVADVAASLGVDLGGGAVLGASGSFPLGAAGAGATCGTVLLGDVVTSVLSSLCVALPLFLVALAGMRGGSGHGAVGGGDVKLLFAVGLYFAWWMNVLLLFAACLVFVVSVMASHRGRPERGQAFPFGPSIAVATWLTSLSGVSVGRFLWLS